MRELEEVKKISEYLDALGDTADTVAEKLKELQITGIPCDSNACPLARYINSFGYTVKVFRGSVFWKHSELYLNTALFVFIGRFDAGLYKELIAQPC